MGDPEAWSQANGTQRSRASQRLAATNRTSVAASRRGQLSHTSAPADRASAAFARTRTITNRTSAARPRCSVAIARTCTIPNGASTATDAPCTSAATNHTSALNKKTTTATNQTTWCLPQLVAGYWNLWRSACAHDPA